MSQNKVKITWKAVVAIMLVMATMIAMSALVSAGFIELVLGEEYGVMATTSSSSSSEPCRNGDGGDNVNTACSSGVVNCKGGVIH